MKLNAVLCIAIALTPVVCVAQHERRLEGCVDPRIIATVLAKLRQSNSQAISVKQVRSMWPTELLDEETSKTSHELQSKDRILKGNCQCCTDFEFTVHQEGGVTREELDGVAVNYSARRRETLVIMAKLFAKAVGLGKAGLRTVGHGSTEDYQWRTHKGSETRLYVIELRFTREAAGLWKMYFLPAWYFVEPLKGAQPRNPRTGQRDGETRRRGDCLLTPSPFLPITLSDAVATVADNSGVRNPGRVRVDQVPAAADNHAE